MKLHVIHDKDGNIVAAVRLDTPTSTDRPVPNVRPVPNKAEGHSATDVYVPPEHAHLDFLDVCRRLKVTKKGKFATLEVKS